MIDLQNINKCPTIHKMADYVGNPLFLEFCTQIRARYACPELIEFSSCSMEKGWNVKFKKAALKLSLPDCSQALQELYRDVFALIRIRREGK